MPATASPEATLEGKMVMKDNALLGVTFIYMQECVCAVCLKLKVV